MKNKPKDEIFEELDRNSSSKNSCTCSTMFGLLVVLLIIVIIGSLYTFHLLQLRINRRDIGLSDISGKDVLAKVENFLSANKKTAPVELVITDKELTTLLQQSSAIDEQFPVKGLQAAITPDAIIFIGTLTKPLVSDFNIHAIPVVTNGSVDFKITKITAGKVTLPYPLIDIISGQVAATIKKNITIFQGIEVKELLLGSGSMVVK